MGELDNIKTLVAKTAGEVNHLDFAEKQPDYLDEDIMYVSDVRRIPDLASSKAYANIICFAHEGTMDLILNGNEQTLEAGNVIFCPSGSVIERPMVSPDFKFTLIAFTDNLLRELLRQNMDIWNRSVYINKGYVIRPHSDQDREMLMQGGFHMTELLRLILDHKDLPFRRDMICSVLHIILLAYCSNQKSSEQEEETSGKEKTHQLTSTTIFNNFITLIHNEKIKHRPVTFYSDQLYITPKHLSFVCKQVSGKPATEIIQDAVTQEIIEFLRNPNYTVKQISELLGFANISFFGKFVKKHLGQSPNEYRKRMIAASTSA